MPSHIIGDILMMIAGVALALPCLVLWFFASNINERRTIISTGVLAGVLITLEYWYYNTHDYFPRSDGALVRWEMPVFTGVQLIIVSLAYAIYAQIDYGSSIGLVFKAIAIAASWVANQLNTGDSRFWFFFWCIGVTFCYTLIKWLATRRTRDNYHYLVLFFGSMAAVTFGIGASAGPENLSMLSEGVQYTLYCIGKIFLVVICIVSMIITQGGEKSILSKGKHKLATSASEVAKNLANAIPDA
jgi:hypothetical protein